VLLPSQGKKYSLFLTPVTALALTEICIPWLPGVGRLDHESEHDLHHSQHGDSWVGVCVLSAYREFRVTTTPFPAQLMFILSYLMT
jgi:hypothetical protein